MYCRNIILSIPVLLSVLYIIQFLIFHHRFGPLTIILGYMVEEVMISTAVMLGFFIGWWLQLCAAYAPICPDLEPELTGKCVCNVQVPAGCEKPFIPSIVGPGIPGCRTNDEALSILSTNFVALFGALLHHGDYNWQTSVRNSPEWMDAFTRIHLSLFHVAMVLTILTIIISVSADTFERMNRRSDLEWKFERAKLVRNTIKASAITAPWNLLVKPIVYLRALFRYPKWMFTKYANHFVQQLDADKQALAMVNCSSSSSFSACCLDGRRRRGQSRGDERKELEEATKVKLEMWLVEIVEWDRVVDRYREELASERRDMENFIEELNCYVDDLKEWQSDLWHEANEIENQVERHNYKQWLIEEFKQVISVV